MKYIAIDGDDVGRLITYCYFNENESRLKMLSAALNDIVIEISEHLKRCGFETIFCAADGITAKTESDIDYIKLFNEIKLIAYEPFTFSVGVADSLKDVYIALMDAKCNGKNTIRIY
ncbi:mCpol domain-containing protein [Aeromonas veronii]|uniref:mCpol domain-containing protein n=1 Tax=Aeromonas veronii TaxID=654 RepID=UPI003D1F2F0C